MENVGQEDSKKSVDEPQANSKNSSGIAQRQEIDPEEDHYGHTRNSVDKMLARAIGRRFTDVLDSVFFFSSAEIKTINVRKDYLQLIVYVPFVLPAPSPEGGMWWDTAAAQNELRRDFAKHLKSSAFKKTFSSLFHTELSHFLLKRGDISKYSKDIQKLLRKLPQQKLAGRPSHPIGKPVANAIKTEGVKICQALQNMEKAIRRWKDKDPKIDDPTIKKKLSRSYPVKTYPWMPIFYELIPKLPRKPYLDNDSDEVIGPDNKLPAAKLSKPDSWSRTDICVKIVRKKCFQAYGTRFSLADIKRILRSAIH